MPSVLNDLGKADIYIWFRMIETPFNKGMSECLAMIQTKSCSGCATSPNNSVILSFKWDCVGKAIHVLPMTCIIKRQENTIDIIKDS
mmetsp:Transcript_10200/g.30788  ORF Transcript_10200/g.30788 Transcript_10200/m.30788 type:complete len:87 (+) Transcript_10200:515-775(+)